MTLYTVVHKLYSNQPDIPWGILKHAKPLAECQPSDLLYIDGYDLTWGNHKADAFGRTLVPESAVSGATWEKPHAELLTHEYGSRPTPGLTDLTLEQMRTALPKAYLKGTWEDCHKIPYLEAFFAVVAKRSQGCPLPHHYAKSAETPNLWVCSKCGEQLEATMAAAYMAGRQDESEWLDNPYRVLLRKISTLALMDVDVEQLAHEAAYVPADSLDLCIKDADAMIAEAVKDDTK